MSIKRAQFVLITSFLLVSLASGHAHAKAYSIPEASVTARVTTSGGVRVTERLTYDFSGALGRI